MTNLFFSVKQVEKTCGPDMFYNPQTKTCDWEDNVLAIKPICGECAPGTVRDECAIECDKLCAHYLYRVREKGLCKEGTKCESGCVTALKKKECPKGMCWTNFTLPFHNFAECDTHFFFLNVVYFSQLYCI